jgi:ferredoxin
MDVVVRFRPSGVEIRVPVGTRLLDAARLAGLPVASACGADGVCGRCGMRILTAAAGALAPETERERDVKQRNRIDPELRLACQARAFGSVEATAGYW